VAEGLDAGRAVRSGIRASLLEMVEDSERDRAELTKERDAALADAAKLREELDGWVRHAKCVEVERDEWQNHASDRRDETRAVQAKLDTAAQERFDAIMRNGALREERDAALAQLSVMTARCEKSEAALNRALTHADQAEAQLAVAKRELGEAYANSERLQAELDGAAHRAEKAEAELAAVERDRDKLDRARELLASEASAQKMRAERAEAQLAERTRERDEAQANYQFMVDRACDEKLDGYRELASKLEKAKAEVARLTDLLVRVRPVFAENGRVAADEGIGLDHEDLLAELDAIAPEPAKEVDRG